MITKAIVEEIISPYQVKVRVPVLDRAEHSPMSTSNDNLNTATICTLPNCYINMQVGDIVFVGFEDNTYYKAIVLGHLCKEFMSDSYSDAILGDVEIKRSAVLPSNTSVGVVSAEEISRLQGVSDNIQQQLNLLKLELQSVYSTLEVINKKLEGGE